jgi:hypothetical protein
MFLAKVNSNPPAPNIQSFNDFKAIFDKRLKACLRFSGSNRKREVQIDIDESLYIAFVYGFGEQSIHRG